MYRDAVDELMGGKTPESLMNRLELNEIDAMGLMEAGAETKAAQLKDMPLDEKVQTRQLPQRGYPHTFPHAGLIILKSSYIHLAMIILYSIGYQ